MSLNPAVAAGTQAVPRRRNGPARRRRGHGRRSWTGWAFVGPFLAVFAFVLIVPIGYAIYLSLYRQQLIGGNAFVGIDNYKTALSDPQFWASLRRVLLFLVVQVPIMTVLALLAALALDSARLRWAPLYRLSIFLPYAVPAVVASFMWGFMYGTQFGLVSRLRSFFGGHFPDPLSSNWVLGAIGNVVTWEFVGYNMLIFYSALRAVPGELYEAAEIDGANQFANPLPLRPLRQKGVTEHPFESRCTGRSPWPPLSPAIHSRDCEKRFLVKPPLSMQGPEHRVRALPGFRFPADGSFSS